MMSIRKAAVIGAGVMDSGIAAHLANTGVEVVLLDMTRQRIVRNRRSASATRRATPVKSGPGYSLARPFGSR